MHVKYEVESTSGVSSAFDLAAAKNYLKINNNADDDVIQLLINAIVAHAERFTGYNLQEKVWSVYRSHFHPEMEIRLTDVLSIESIEYQNTNEITTLIDPSTYYLMSIDHFSKIVAKSDWPTDIGYWVGYPVHIKLTTGVNRRYDEILVQMLRHLAFAYENRADDGTDPSFGFNATDFYKSTSIPVF